jgi:HAD-superfamily hydrolase (TIGR02245 family)
MNDEVRVCITCFDSEQARLAKEARRREKREQAKQEQHRLNELFEELRIAYEKSDEDRALMLKAEIDVLKDSIMRREVAKEEKRKRREEKLLKKAKKRDKSKRSSGGNKQSEEKKDKKEKKKEKVPKQHNNANNTKSGMVEIDLEDDDPHLDLKMQLVCSTEIKVMNLPTEESKGRRCLVLDIDYTLFDHHWYEVVKEEFKSDTSIIPEFKRPYLHEFLKVCYESYDIVIWSATSMAAIDAKMKYLGVYTNPDYKISLVLSKENMFLARKKKGGKVWDETIKPLQVIWSKFGEFYSKKNTIHIDDVSTNFQLNPENGLQVTPFKEALKNRHEDKELFFLTKYLLIIAKDEEDFSVLNHMKWKEYIISKLWQKQTEYVIPPPPEAKAGDLKGSLLRSKFKSTYFNTIFGADPEELSNNNNLNNNQINVSPESDTVQRGDLDTRATVVELGDQMLPPSWLRNRTEAEMSGDVSNSQAIAPSPRSRIANHRHTIRRVSSFDDIDQVRLQNNLEASLDSTLVAHRKHEPAPLRRRHSSETPRSSMELTQASHDNLMHELANELKDEIGLDSDKKENGNTTESRAETEAKEMPAVVEQEKQKPESDQDNNDDDSDLC